MLADTANNLAQRFEMLSTSMQSFHRTAEIFTLSVNTCLTHNKNGFYTQK